MMIETPQLRLTYTPTGGSGLEFGVLRVIDKATGEEHVRWGVLHRPAQRMLNMAIGIVRGVGGGPPPESRNREVQHDNL